MGYSKFKKSTAYESAKTNIFCCLEEGNYYASILERMAFNKYGDYQDLEEIIEFGSGNGRPVITALLNSSYFGTVIGYEINAIAVEEANRLAAAFKCSNQYIVNHKSFFEVKDTEKADCLIANPPYLPADDREILLLPDLCGGKDGTDVSTRILSVGCKNVILLISSYSDPESTIKHAIRLGYKIMDFEITKMPFGVYSRQNVVQKRIHEMRTNKQAFFTDKCYLVGAVYFTKNRTTLPDLSQEFLSCITSL